MTTAQIFRLVIQVVLSWQTLFIVAAIALYIKLVNYICHYKKRVKSVKRKSSARKTPQVSPPPPPTQTEEESDEDSF